MNNSFSSPHYLWDPATNLFEVAVNGLRERHS